MSLRYPKRVLIPPMPPRARLMRESFGVLVEIKRPSTELANRCILLINDDRKADAAPRRGWFGR